MRSMRTPSIIFLVALALRAIFAVLTSGTFDPDEFVVLALGRAVAHGAVPYRDVIFFHPPGMLVYFGALQHLTSWWPAGRIAVLVLDSLTAVLVWRMAREFLSDREAVIAGLLYACNPIALVSGVRIGPDPIVTFLGTLALLVLLIRKDWQATVLAGICLALAVWTKYTGILFLPIALLIAWERAHILLASWALALACLFAPFLPESRDLVAQTVLWQTGQRSAATLSHRVMVTGIYWLALNPFAAFALLRRSRPPLWVVAGFLLGALFLFTPRAYYHYFDIVAPFAALLGAPLVAFLARRTPVLLAGAAAASTVLWGLDVGHGNPAQRLSVSATSLAQAEATADVIDRVTPRSGKVLADQFEYALFAGRPLATDYFWDMAQVTSARSLERGVGHLAAVVQTKHNHSFPRGFIDYLQDRRYPHQQTARAVVWFLDDRDRSRD